MGTVVLMAKAMHGGELFGLSQRLDYGVGVLWIAALALQSLRTRQHDGLQMAIV
ncbi:hypothetical protein [Pseudomonas mosselii]|uniref:hypothetical protein n=1 Tax=Pseudomonas mosselii TaxID=78327 RepID=UPI0015E8A481|nr:hypothetical protein [Pseudomonas mosselii]